MILLILALVPLVGGFLLEFLVCQFTRKGSKLWKLIPPVAAVLVTAAIVVHRLNLWEADTSPVTQLLFIPGLPALGFFVGLFLGWKLYRWLWKPKIVRDKKEGK
ncbi:MULTISPECIES: Tat pathway signal protein [unclassified Flavonifractor]|uniref:Tat pathway signal protein n=1 Tax=unclassified Flavonifractor TaxID=2629267 RepID=UPI000B383541|nr:MULTISPECIES: Tat pathway signal protein [unclassified Flavonifractor]OUN11647.1 Tat pathway signal protein [Flavonifractor sp. An9]OUN12904.1 Tat pathway signal protein [Flavonifractor sp. An91]OUO11356.1 Tat pathway signal protein [Flavonifractor sp. An4]OUQ58099.1 Tat pathway signal protein [Flavonifractor sp. An112]